MAGHFEIVRIVSAVSVMCAAFLSNELDAKSNSVSRLSLFQEPLRLTAVQRREWQAWSQYAKSLYRGFENDSRRAFLEGLEQALVLMPKEQVLRERWASSAALLGLTRKEVCQRYEKIYAAAPEDVDNALFYAKLLRESGRTPEAVKVLHRGVELTAGREGRLVRDLVMVCTVNGEFRSSKEYGSLAQLLDRSMSLPDVHDRDAVKVAQGYYWLVHSDAMLDSEEKGKEVPPETLKQVRELRRRVMVLFSEIAVSRVDSTTRFLVYVAWDTLKQYGRLQQVLREVQKSGGQDSVWLEYAFKAAEATGDYQILYAYLDGLTFTEHASEELLMRSVRAYLAQPGHAAEAIRLVRLLVKKSPSRLEHRQLLGYLLFASGKPQEGLDILAGIPFKKRIPSIHLLWGRMLVSLGRKQEAYEYWKGIGVTPFRKAKASGGTGNASNPLLEEYLQSLGLLCLELKKTDEALEAIRRGYELQRDNPVWCNLYGYLLADLGRQLPLAEKLIRQALAKEPGSIAFLDSLAWVLFRKGDCRGALEVMAQVIEKGGLKADSTHEMHDHLSHIFRSLGLAGIARLYELELE